MSERKSTLAETNLDKARAHFEAWRGTKEQLQSHSRKTVA